MKIKVLKSCSGYNFSFTAGQEYEVTNEIGNDLVHCGFAEKAAIEKMTKPKTKTAEKAADKSEKSC